MADVEGDELVLEENMEPAAAMEEIYVEPWRQSATPSVHVCVGGACTQDGSHTTLAEIEDLWRRQAAAARWRRTGALAAAERDPTCLWSMTGTIGF